MPRRRTFASGILPFAHSELTALRPSWASLVSYAGSQGMGNPSQAREARDGERAYCRPAGCGA
jgi:hypothetical protein